MFFNNPVSKFSKLLDSGVMYDYKKEELIHIKDIQANLRGRDYYYGTSRLFAAVDTSMTLKFLAETINSILSAKGHWALFLEIQNQMKLIHFNTKILLMMLRPK